MADPSQLQAALGFRWEPGEGTKYGWIVARPAGAAIEQRKHASVQERKMWEFLAGLDIIVRSGNE